MPVVQLQPREHFSTLAGVTGGISEMLSAIMQTREYNAEQKRQEDERRRAKEFQDFDIAMKLRQAAIEEASVPEFGERPMEDKTTQIPVQSKTGGYLASLVPVAAPPQPPPI